MAITWDVKITVLNPERKNVSVVLEQIDDADPENIKVLKSFSVLDALIDTTERKQQVINELRRQYDVEKQKETNDAEIIGTLEDDIKTTVQSWEVK